MRFQDLGLGRETGWSKVHSGVLLTATLISDELAQPPSAPHTTSTITYTPLLPLPPNPCDNANANRIPFRITYLLRSPSPSVSSHPDAPPMHSSLWTRTWHALAVAGVVVSDSQATITFED
ncbi:hypothetical protein D9758_018906 [Tetrapyrgos nigripes]|uniref:Uncharacterized protein n=1 Tax=Tetrapyrgos nigripes TaxID=182062 RepID=A0A8H5B6X7_9AGAR|nr:hypothetical protein D9758_018906 [Tetrapyrgos nigripes]